MASEQELGAGGDVPENIPELENNGQIKPENGKGVIAAYKETQHFTNTTTMHGPKRIFNGRNAGIRIAWGLVFCCAIGGLSYQVVCLVLDYLANETIGQISFELSPDGMSFPAVTFCNLNPIKNSEIQQLNKSGDLSYEVLEYLLQTNMDATFHYSNLDRLELERVHRKAKVFMENHPEFDIDTFLKTSGSECEETFSLCYFGGQRFDCCDFMSAVVTSIGKCYTLDLANRAPKWLQKQVTPGSDTGLQIIADSNLQEEMNIAKTNDAGMFFEIFEHGFRYFIHPPDAHPELSSEGVSVGPAKVVYSAIKKTTKSLLTENNAKKKCLSKYPQYLGTDLTYYSKNSCRYLCFAHEFSNKCNCSSFTYNIDSRKKTCLPHEAVRCMDQYMQNDFDPMNETKHLEFPGCAECLPECESDSYTTSNSYGTAFNKGSLKWLSNRLNKTTDHISQSVSVINVFYSDMFNTKYTQTTTTSLVKTLSDIGGNMGMFLGMSVITITEISLYLTKLFSLFGSSSRRERLYEKKIKDDDKEEYLDEEVKKYQDKKKNRSEEHPPSNRQDVLQHTSTRIENESELPISTSEVTKREQERPSRKIHPIQVPKIEAKSEKSGSKKRGNSLRQKDKLQKQKIKMTKSSNV